MAALLVAVTVQIAFSYSRASGVTGPGIPAAGPARGAGQGHPSLVAAPISLALLVLAAYMYVLLGGEGAARAPLLFAIAGTTLAAGATSLFFVVAWVIEDNAAPAAVRAGAVSVLWSALVIVFVLMVSGYRSAVWAIEGRDPFPGLLVPFGFTVAGSFLVGHVGLVRVVRRIALRPATGLVLVAALLTPTLYYLWVADQPLTPAERATVAPVSGPPEPAAQHLGINPGGPPALGESGGTRSAAARPPASVRTAVFTMLAWYSLIVGFGWAYRPSWPQTRPSSTLAAHG